MWSTVRAEVVTWAEVEQVRMTCRGEREMVGEEGSGSQKKEEAERAEQDDQEKEEEEEEEEEADARTHKTRVLLLRGKHGQTACRRRRRLPCLRSTAGGGTHCQRERERDRDRQTDRQRDRKREARREGGRGREREREGERA